MSRLYRVAVVLGLPSVTAPKVEKMKLFFLSLIQKIDPNFTKENLEAPVNGNGDSIGVIFVTCADSAAVENFVSRCDNMSFDKNTKLRIMKFETYEKYLNGQLRPEPIVVPKPPSDPVQFSWYLLQEDFLDQIAFLTDDFSHAAWFDHYTGELKHIDMPTHIPRVSDINFTNDGAFFIAKTKDGSKLNFYTGKQWTHFTTIDFPRLDSYVNSPCGRFVLCKAKISADIDNKFSPNGAALFDILTGKRLAKIPLNKNEFDLIAFGAGSNLLALQDHHLRCYKAKDFSETIDVCADADSFSPSLTSKLVFTFRKARGTQPPRIAFHNSEADSTIHVVAAFNAVECKPYWHPKKALCAVVQSRYVKNRESSSLVVFDLTNEKAIATFTEDTKGTILSCSWDPQNNNIAIIVATPAGRQLIIYEIAKNMTVFRQFPCSSAEIQFSPAGRFLVANDIRSGSPRLQFCDSHDGFLNSPTLEGVANLEWDPSGAFLLASSGSQSSWFDFFFLDGEHIHKNTKVASLKKIMWRPNALQAVLSPEDLEKIQEESEAVLKSTHAFGHVDPKVKEEENQQQKLSKLENWIRLRKNVQISAPKAPPKQTIEFKPYEEFEDKE